MKKEETVKTLSEAFEVQWADIEAAYSSRLVKPIPEGWISVAEYAKKKNISPRVARDRLHEMWQAGLVERQNHYGSRIIYRPKKK